MNIKVAEYKLHDGSICQVKYDAYAPCWYCGFPVGEASMGGTVVCPSCDCGLNHDGSRWTAEQARTMYRNFDRFSKVWFEWR
jgi:hypothetical protein